MTRLLMVDDEAAVLSALQRALRQRLGSALEVVAETDAMAALERCRHEVFDIVISDLRMPEIDGVTLLSLIGALRPASVRMILTASNDLSAAQRAIQDAGVFRFLSKPWVDSELAAHMRAAMAQVDINRTAALQAG